MDRFAHRVFQILALLLASFSAAWATPPTVFALSEFQADAANQSADFVRSAEAQPLFKAIPGHSILLRERRPRWWRLTATANISADNSPQFVMSQPFGKALELWRPGDTSPVRRTVYGPDSDLTHSAVAHVVPLPEGLRVGESIYVRVFSSANLASELSILPLSEIYAQDNAFNRVRTIALTTLGAVALLAAGFAVSLRQRGYIYLAITLLAQLISLGIEGGDFRGTASLAAFTMDRRTDIVLNTAAVLASVRFLMFFLNLPMTQPLAARVLNVCSVALGIVLAASIFQTWSKTALIGNLVLLTVIATVVPACLYAMHRRQREAFILMAAWMPLILALVVKIGSLHHWWQTFEWLQYGYPAAMAFGGLGLLLGLTYKIRQLNHAWDSARQRADYDGLTGVLARPALNEALELAGAQARGSGNPLSIAFVDVDRFKAINDAHGHAVGDEVLRIIAMRVRNRLRSDDTLGRYGGDEMVLIFPNTPLAEAVRFSEHLRRSIADSPLSIDGKIIEANLSVGVAQLRNHEAIPDLLKRADGALYDSKREGRGRVTGHGEHEEKVPDSFSWAKENQPGTLSASNQADLDSAKPPILSTYEGRSP